MLWNLEQFADNMAFCDESGVSLTYAQLKEETGAVARAVGKRCLVFALCENSIGSILGYVAFMNGGIVPLLLNRHLDLSLIHI